MGLSDAEKRLGYRPRSGLSTWVTRNAGPSFEEKEAAKLAQKQAKKESMGRLKELTKMAAAASEKANTSGTKEDHQAAADAHNAASKAYQKHYYGFRASRATAERIHDDQRAHGREAQTHTDKVTAMNKAEQDKRNADWEERQKDPRVQSENKANAAMKQADLTMEHAYSSRLSGAVARDSYAQAHEKYKEAHNHYLDAGKLSDATNMAKWAGRAADKAGIDFDAEKHPRDEHGRFTGK